MRKLPTRPPRFVAVDNRAVDDQRLSVLDIGLLTMALRLPDGADFTIAALAQTRKPGREALTKAMRNLVAYGYIVKLKIQDATDGTWRTEFSVSRPAPPTCRHPPPPEPRDRNTRHTRRTRLARPPQPAHSHLTRANAARTGRHRPPGRAVRPPPGHDGAS